MSAGLKILDQFNVPYEVRITSAHRTPELMSEFAEEVSKGGVQVIIAGAGGAAHRKFYLEYKSLPACMTDINL